MNLFIRQYKETEEIYLRARYYQPAVGRFLTRDTYTGEEDDPLSLHLYGYCGNDGVNQLDPTGHKAKAIPVAKGAPKYEPKKWNKESVRIRTNCYAYAFNFKKNPITKQNFGTGRNSIFAMQPGMFCGQQYNSEDFITKEGVIDRVEKDMKKLKYKFKPISNKKVYKKITNKRSWLVYLVVTKKGKTEEKTKNNIICLDGADYHWYRQDKSGKWSHKPGNSKVTRKDAKGKIIKNPSKADKKYCYKNSYRGITIIENIKYENVGFFKVTKKKKG